MPWVGTVIEQRQEFLAEFRAEGVNRRAVCRRWGVSAKTAYKLARREANEGAAGLLDQSRRPRTSPGRTSSQVEARVLAVRDAHPAWGARKIAKVLERAGGVEIPAYSTITEILRRHGRITEEASRQREHYQRFERARPNELWQMDFKGHFGLGDGSRCHPLVLLDDHSRYCVALRACANERGTTVRGELEQAFREHGLPEEMLMDNGSPWGNDYVHVYTPLVVWLLQLEIGVKHGRPRHPQTQGKLERLNLTLKLEVLDQAEGFASNPEAQRSFDSFRPAYNQERPHEALEMEVPSSRYKPSERDYPEKLPAIEYDESDAVRRVQEKGLIWYEGVRYRVPKAFRGHRVAVRATEREAELAVYFGRQRIAVIDQKGGRARPVRG